MGEKSSISQLIFKAFTNKNNGQQELTEYLYQLNAITFNRRVQAMTAG
jgi:hypothetical protein